MKEQRAADSNSPPQVVFFSAQGLSFLPASGITDQSIPRSESQFQPYRAGTNSKPHIINDTEVN
jgi:hypothetical protein